MESLHEDPILLFPPDLLQNVRKEFGLEKPGEMDRAIDILEVWLKKQDHFLKKEFSRGYLERSIIRAKGSVERAKERLDKICSGRTVFPQLYTITNVKKFDDLQDHVYDFTCPKLTDDYCRVYVIHIRNSVGINAQMFYEYYIKGLYALEYCCARDYPKGVVVIFDYTNLNIVEFLKAIDVMEAARLMNLALNGYGLRVKEIHLVSSSKLINVLVSTFKQFLSEKIANRIEIHNEVESLQQFIDKEILPKELGGTGQSVQELHDRWLEILSSENFLSEIKETYEAKIDENLRPLKLLNDDLGVAGTFRSLSVD